jgi:SAM-dependent methyltransferase
MGYSDEELAMAPEGANLGFGCGNPAAIAGLRDGEVVLDLGSGAGFDCFIAAQAVGPQGRVIGVDMTPEMIEKANANLVESGAKNIEFRMGDIENLPVESGTIDVVISNCVLNLVPDKAKAFGEIYRVLKPGGRAAVSDIVKLRELPPEIEEDADALSACVSGALMKEDYLEKIWRAGLSDVKVESCDDFGEALLSAPGPGSDWLREAAPGGTFGGFVASIKVAAVKPRPACDCGGCCG